MRRRCRVSAARAPSDQRAAARAPRDAQRAASCAPANSMSRCASPATSAAPRPATACRRRCSCASARAAAEPAVRPGARVGERIEAAVAATLRGGGLQHQPRHRAAVRAARARRSSCGPRPASGGAARRDRARCWPISIVARCPRRLPRDRAAPPRRAGHRVEPRTCTAPPSIDLRAAMALAAERDSIARQYRDGYAELFELGLPPLPASGFRSVSPDGAAVDRHGRRPARLPDLPGASARFTHCSQTRRQRGTQCHALGAGLACPGACGRHSTRIPTSRRGTRAQGGRPQPGHQRRSHRGGAVRRRPARPQVADTLKKPALAAHLPGRWHGS